jgi:hypothetical protein
MDHGTKAGFKRLKMRPSQYKALGVAVKLGETISGGEMEDVIEEFEEFETERPTKRSEVSEEDTDNN